MKDSVTIVYEGVEEIVNKYIGDPKSEGQISVVDIRFELEAKLGLDLVDNALIIFNNRHDKKYCTYEMVNALYLEWYCTSYPYGEWLEDNTNGMNKRITQANDNIESLIDEIISLKKESDSGVCPFPDRQDTDACNSDNCEDCEKEYFEKKRKAMLLQYKV